MIQFFFRSSYHLSTLQKLTGFVFMNILIVNIESDIFVNKFSLCENTKINAVYRICLMTLSDIQIV